MIGSGVSGLTSAVALQEAGLDVSIVTREVPPNTTSDRAAAIWFPYLAYPADRVTRWARHSYEIFAELAETPDSGISMVEMIELFDEPANDPDWMGSVIGLRRLAAAELPHGYRDGLVATVPLIETPRYLPFLMRRFAELGGTITMIEGGLADLQDVAAPAGLIINCSGLGARDLSRDSDVHPIRGQVVRTTNPGLRRAIADDFGHLSLAYVVPRSDDCILGGTAERDVWELEPDEEVSRDIVRRCMQLEPGLERAEILGAAVGLRPGRSEVRLESEMLGDGCKVIHNYGHGGAGFTLSWGCAAEVVELAKA